MSLALSIPQLSTAQARQYIEEYELQGQLEAILEKLLLERPLDPCDFLATEFAALVDADNDPEKEKMVAENSSLRDESNRIHAEADSVRKENDELRVQIEAIKKKKAEKAAAEDDGDVQYFCEAIRRHSQLG